MLTLLELDLVLCFQYLIGHHEHIELGMASNYLTLPRKELSKLGRSLLACLFQRLPAADLAASKHTAKLLAQENSHSLPASRTRNIYANA